MGWFSTYLSPNWPWFFCCYVVVFCQMATIQSYSDEIEREILKQQIDVEYSYAG